MKEEDFRPATSSDRQRHVIRPYEEVPVTELVKGSNSRLVFGKNATVSFLTMTAGSVFELHSHPEEQIMIVLEGFCDEIIGDKIYRVREGDVIWLPSGVTHGAFVREVDCKVIDLFAPARADYRTKYSDQHPANDAHFA